MTDQQMERAQEYLTMMSENRVKRIVNLEALYRKHPTQAILWLLRHLYLEKESRLKTLISENRMSWQIDQAVAVMFRIQMAMWVIENERKEVEAA